MMVWVVLKTAVVFLLYGVMGLIISLLLWSLLRSTPLKKEAPWPHFYLPNDFFITLVLLGNFWLILLCILGAQSLPDDDKQMVIIITSLFAPFASWWRIKKIRGHS